MPGRRPQTGGDVLVSSDINHHIDRMPAGDDLIGVARARDNETAEVACETHLPPEGMVSAPPKAEAWLWNAGLNPGTGIPIEQMTEMPV